MDLVHAVILALIQGITEFLPISSSGHLVLAPHLFGWQDQGLHFDIATNTGSWLAVVIYFRSDVVSLLESGWVSIKRRTVFLDPEARLFWSLALATIPVGLVGLMFKEQIATLVRDPIVIATTSILFGVLLWWSDRVGDRTRPLRGIRWRDALFIGLAQALALIPGTSRSGITITAGLFAGFNRHAAARFSFLMTLPIGILAGGLDLVELTGTDLSSDAWMAMGLGMAVSGISAYLVIDWLLGWLRRRTLTPFVIYRILLGCVIFALVL
ncbi:MAG: undecaprenyl-diphosphate phosphatase [Magnetococcales bacterium]|nr:undecaprenyl-diphosphate phosphatase [Magnetococcales bacterium]